MARRKNENIEEIKIKASQEGLNEATQSAEKLEKQTGKAKKSAKELSDTLENTGKGAKDAAKGIQVLDGQMKEFAENVKAVREALEGIKAVLDTKGIRFDTTGIQQQIGTLKVQINDLNTAMTQAFKDDKSVDNWIKKLRSAVGDIGNIRNNLFNKQESLPIKVNPVLVDKQGNEIREFVPLKEMSEFFKNTTQFQKSIPLKSIDELVVKLNEISRIMREIMTGLRLDSKLPSTVLEQEEKRITEIIESLSKEITKYDKLKSKFTGLDESGKFHSNSTISTARQIFEREMPEEKDIQRFEKEIVKLLSFGEDLQNISIKVKGGVANYFQIVQQMIGQYRGSMLKLGEGGLLDFLPSYFEKLRDSQGKISWGKQIIDENSFAQQYKKLLAEQKYYQKQFSYAKAREEQVSATSLDDKTINAVANAFQNVKINAVEAGTTINSVAQLDTEQLNSLVTVLENVVTWLTNINTALNTLSTNASILQNISNLNFDVNEQTKVDDLAASVEDKNKQYLDFLERINSLTNSILESISKIQVHANELNLDKLFKNFNTQKVGTKEEIEKAKADVIAAEKSVKVGKAWVDQADALNKLADAYSKFKQVGGTESITDFTKKSGLAKQIDQRMTTGEKVSLPIDIVPQITQDFLGQIRQAIGNESIYVDVKPDILNVISNFIQPITDAVKGTPVEVEIKPIVNKFITDLQQTIKGLNSKEVITSLQSTLGDQSKSIKVNVIPSDANAFIKTLQGAIDILNKPIKIKVEPIVKSFIKDITTILTEQKKNTVPINLTPVIDKSFKEDLQQKINTKKINLNIIPAKNNVQDFINQLQSAITVANKPIKIKVEPILKDFVKRCEEILANQAVNVNFKPQNPIMTNKGKPFTNDEMRELLALETNASSRTSTNIVNGQIVSGKVVSNLNGKERTYTVDQYGNEKIIERTADKVKEANKQQRESTKQLEEEYRRLINDSVKKLEEAYRGLIKTEKDYLTLQERIKDGQKLTASQQSNLSQLQIDRQDYQNTINSIHLLDSSLDVLKQKYANVQSSMPNVVSDLIKNEYIDDTLKKVDKLEKLINSGKYTGASTKEAQDYLKNLPNIQALDLDTIKKYNVELDNLFNNTLKKAGNETKLQKLLNNITDEMQKNSAMSKKLASDFEQLRNRVQTLLSSGNFTPDDIKALTNEFIALDTELIKSGKTGKSFFKTLSNDIKTSSARMISYYASFQAIIRYIRSMISAVSDLDKALNTLRIVSNATQSELKNITATSHQMAQELGSTTTEVISSITEWRRLGKTLEESKILAEQAAKLSAGGIMDISTATTALTSSMQAFELKADEIDKVVDQYIYLGNNYAITSEQLATSLTKSVAALKTAGNSLEQVEALEVAGNAILQDADVVSNSLKVLSLRLRGTTGSALEEIGEDTEGLIEDFSKLNNKIQALTKTASNPEGVSIIDKQTKGYKSTYQILLEISKVWKDIGNMQQAELLEIIAGKTRASAAAGILSSPEILQSAYQDAMYNSTGAGQAALDIAMESIAAKSKQIKDNFTQIANNLFDAQGIKGLLTTFRDFTDELYKNTDGFNNIITALEGLLSLILKVISVIPPEGLLGAIIGMKNLNGIAGTLSANKLFDKINTGIFKLPITQNDVTLLKNYYTLRDAHYSIDQAWGMTMQNASKSAQQAAKSIILQSKGVDDATIAMSKQIKTSKALTIATGALNLAWSVGATLILTKLVSVITQVVNAEENFAKAAQNAADSYSEASSNIDSYKSKISNLQSIINDENSSVEEVVQAKTDLYDIQEELIGQFGNVAEGVDSITAAVDGEVESLETLKQLKWEETLANFNADTSGKGLDGIFMPILEALSGDAGKAGLKILNPDYYKSNAELATVAWLQGDKTNASFARQYFKNEILKNEYSETYSSLEELNKAYSKAIKSIDGVSAEQMQYFSDKYLSLIGQFSDVGQEALDSIYINLAQNAKKVASQKAEQQSLIDEVTDVYKTYIAGVFRKNGVKNSPILTMDDLEDVGWISDNIIEDFGVKSSEEVNVLIQAIADLEQKGVYTFGSLKRHYKELVEEFRKQSNIETISDSPLFTYESWTGQNSKLTNSKDNKKYKNNELIELWKTSATQFKDFLVNDREGQIDIQASDIINVVDKDELFKSLGMNEFQTYLDKFGNKTAAMLAYIQDAEDKVKENLDGMLDEKGQQTLLNTLDNIKLEMLDTADANSIRKVRDSYDELNEVLKETQEDTHYSHEEITELIRKYPSLKSAIKEYSDGSYTIQSENIENLISEYADLYNSIVEGYKTAKKAALQFELQQLEVLKDVNEVLSEYDKYYNPDYRGSNYGGIFDGIADPKKVGDLIAKYKKEIAEFEEEFPYVPGSGNGGSGSGKGDKDNKSQYDWLDSYLDKRNRKVQKLQTAYDNLGKQVIKSNDIEKQYYQNANTNLTEQNKALDDQIAAYTEAKKQYKEIRMGEGVLYQALVDAFGGSESKANNIIQKIINRESVELTEYTSDQASAISAIADTFNKALDAEDTILEAQNQKHENLLKQHSNDIELITKQYDHVLNEFANRQAELEHYQTMRTNAGMMENQKYYIALLDNESRELEANIQKRDELIDEIKEMNPTTEDELELWWDTKNAIDETTKSIWESQEAIESYQMNMKQLSWDLNDRIRDITGNLRNETEFLMDTLGTFEKDMYAYERQYLGNDAEKTKIYNGQMSAEGLSTLALRRVRAKSFREDIDAINDEIEEARADYMSNTTNITYLDRLNDLIGERQSLIESYNDEREAIVQLVDEGYQKQLESLDAITNKYIEARNAERDLFEYQRNIAKQTKNIANIRKQIMAYSGDDEESRMRIQQLRVQLEEAEEGLSDTQYQRTIEDQQRIFDHLYQSLSDYFADIMEKPEQVLKSTESLVNDNMPQIKETLDKTMDFYDSEVSQSLKNILNENGLKGVKNNIATADGDIQGITQSVVNQTSELEEYYAKYHLEPTSETKLKDRMKILYGDAEGSFTDYFNQFNTKLGDINNAITDATQRAELFKELAHYISGAFITGLSSFMDTPITRSDNAILTPINMTQSSLSNSVDTVNKWLGISGISGKDIFSSGITPTNVEKKSDVTVNNSMSPTIVVNGVSNVSDFIKEFQKNKAAEAMVQSMTIGLLNGNSAMAKYKYKV